MEVGSEERVCPHCGKELQETRKFDCPFCGELIPVESRTCPFCGINLSDLPVQARSQPIDKIRTVLLADRGEVMRKTAGNGPKKFKCPKCGALLDGSESTCPECSQFLISESGLKCPVCLTTVEKRRRKCPKCGIALAGVRREALEMIPYSAEPEAEPAVGPEERVGPHECPDCGAMIQEELLRCPSCEAKAAGEKVESEAEESVPEPPVEAPASPQSQLILEVSERPKTRNVRVRKLKQQAGGPPQGPPDRVSMVTARGMTNGTGAVNGRSFVNGTGISNGLGSQRRTEEKRRRGRAIRWQFMAVLIVIVLLIPAFMYLSYETRKERYAIDGNFTEWDQATVFGTRIPSSSPSSNITEWAVGAQASDLFVYFKTESQMMSSAEAESYYLFVDSDGSAGTGYQMESVGADYMLQLTGWDDAVNSSSLYEYPAKDQLNWNAWVFMSSLSYSTDGLRMEAKARMPFALPNLAKFVLLSKDSAERGSVSYVAPLRGSLLIAEQAPTADVVLDGLVPKFTSVQVLTIRFTAQGGDGRVDQINPQVEGASMTAQVPSFSIGNGESKEVTIAVDTSAASPGDLISAELHATGIVSSFSSVEIDGFGATAYVVSPPPASIVIDGAFADWTGRLSMDRDTIPVPNPNIDIDEVGNVSTSQDSFFYVSVEGEICSGSFVPATVERPSGAGGGGGTVIPARKTAEDVLRIYIDSDRSNSTGEWVVLDTKQIGADQLIEIKGLYGNITSMKEFSYSPSGDWLETDDVVHAANDAKRMEISVTSASLAGSADVDFIVETTSWKGRGDLATFDPSSTRAFTQTWVVDSLTTSPYATSMSYQRKIFYDGLNFWSFFFDGKDTVSKFSVDDGQTWVLSGPVFATPGVNETSIWYDSATSTVYAIGDTSLPTNNVTIQVGAVDAAARTISWAARDSSLNTSSFPLAGKNTYISKDANGYLWVLSSNSTSEKGNRFWMNAFKSRNVNNTDSWMDTGQMLPWYLTVDNAKGSIVPAGSGSDVWAVYIYGGYVSARKYTGTWQADQRVYTLFGSTANTDNSPPSVVVDKKGVVHVVYGTGLRVGGGGGVSTPEIMYSHNDTDLTTFTAGLNLDPNLPKGVGGYYPTISLDSSTGSLYVVWLQNVLGDASYAPRTLVGRKCVSGAWSNLTMEPQTTFPKQYLTSIYSGPGEFKIGWQWTQNSTAPIEVLFDTTIPEFPAAALPIVGILVMLVAWGRVTRPRKRDT